MTSDTFRPRLSGVALLVGAAALFAAQLVRPDHAHDASAIIRAVAGGGGAASTASLLYLGAAIALIVGLVALAAAVASGPGRRLLVISIALTAAGALWFAVEAALMQFVHVLATARDAAEAANQLQTLNAGFGLIATLPWFFYLAPLGIAIGLRRATLAGGWMIGLWAAGFAIGFAANSPLGESIPALALVNDALLSGLFVAIGVVIVSADGTGAIRASAAARAASTP